MATKTPARPSLTDEQLPELMGLLRGSDSVDLKLTVPAAQQRAAGRALGLDALDAQIRQVVFFDTPDLALDKVGVVVRARRIHGRIGDSVTKLRTLDPEQVSKDVRRLVYEGSQRETGVTAFPGTQWDWVFYVKPRQETDNYSQLDERLMYTYGAIYLSPALGAMKAGSGGTTCRPSGTRTATTSTAASPTGSTCPPTRRRRRSGP
jgi:hypothetical protein